MSSNDLSLSNSQTEHIHESGYDCWEKLWRETVNISPSIEAVLPLSRVMTKRRYIAWMEINLDIDKWIYETPFGAHVNDTNWCPIFLSSWIGEKADDPLEVSNQIFLLMSETNFLMHGSPRYRNTLITARSCIIIQVNLLLSSCHLLTYTQSVLYIPRQDSNPGFRETFVTGEIVISYAISKS